MRAQAAVAQARGERGIISQRRTGTYHDGIAVRPIGMHPVACLLARNPLAGSIGRGRKTVQRLCELQGDVGSLGAHGE